ncbi:MAG: NAD-dependent epimerase/dehydratase family protein [Candidatus Zixiibacteriota bacterium]|nr:MAG: NAD-dependent epimerase/dehydratase family protein [candidate division Zixibacteria bacterium]
MEDAMKIFLTGGTGFVGRHLVNHLKSRGHDLVALVRRPGSLTGVREIVGDVTQPRTFPPDQLQGCEAVIHLVGISREDPARKVTFPRLHVDAVRHVLEACRQAGIRRYLHMSALGASHQSGAKYQRTKAQAEDLVRVSGLDWTIFRPSVIIGPSGEFARLLVNLVKFRLTPLLGEGNYVLSPISIATMVRAFGNALENDIAIGKTYELGGDTITFRTLLERISQTLERPVFFINIPVGLIRTLAGPLDRFAFMPITREQLIMLQEYRPPRDNAIYQELGLYYKSLEEVLHENLAGGPLTEEALEEEQKEK